MAVVLSEFWAANAKGLYDLPLMPYLHLGLGTLEGTMGGWFPVFGTSESQNLDWVDGDI